MVKIDFAINLMKSNDIEYDLKLISVVPSPLGDGWDEGA